MSRSVILGCIAISVLHVIHFLFFETFKPVGIDYRVFWDAARLPLSALYQTGISNPFVYPPTALIFFKPLALVGLFPGLLIWTWLSLSSYVLAVGRAANLSVAFISACSFSVLSGAILGQSSLLLAAAILVAFELPSLACGILLGLVLSIKPQLVLLAPLVLFVRRDWQALTGMAAAAFGSVAVELAIFGPLLWREWFNAIPHFHDTLIRFGVLRFVITPAGMAEAWGWPSLPFLLFGWVVAVVAVALLARRLERIELAALVVTASVISSPYALPHDLAAIIPACVLYLLNRPNLTLLSAAGVFASLWPGIWLIAGLIATAASSLRVGRLTRRNSNLAPINRRGA